MSATPRMTLLFVGTVLVSFGTLLLACGLAGRLGLSLLAVAAPVMWWGAAVALPGALLLGMGAMLGLDRGASKGKEPPGPQPEQPPAGDEIPPELRATVLDPVEPPPSRPRAAQAVGAPPDVGPAPASRAPQEDWLDPEDQPTLLDAPAEEPPIRPVTTLPGTGGEKLLSAGPALKPVTTWPGTGGERLLSSGTDPGVGGDVVVPAPADPASTDALDAGDPRE